MASGGKVRILEVFAVVAFLYSADVRTESALSRLRKGFKTCEFEMPYSDLPSSPRNVKTRGYVIPPRYYPAPDCRVHVCALSDINGKRCNFGLSPGSSRGQSIERQLWQYSSG
jgi:hypothetical protein